MCFMCCFCLMVDREAALDKIKDELHWRGRAVPQQLRKMNKVVFDKSKSLVVGGVRGLLKASRDPKSAIMGAGEWLYVNLLKPPMTEEEQELERILKQVKADEERAKQEQHEKDQQEAIESLQHMHHHGGHEKHIHIMTESERERREQYRASQPKPIAFADTVQVTITLLVDPPPHFERKLALTRQEELRKAIEDKIEALNVVNDKLRVLAGMSMGALNMDANTTSKLPELIKSMLRRTKGQDLMDSPVANAQQRGSMLSANTPNRGSIVSAMANVGNTGLARNSMLSVNTPAGRNSVLSGITNAQSVQLSEMELDPQQPATLTEFVEGRKRSSIESIAGVSGGRFVSDTEYAGIVKKVRLRKQQLRAHAKQNAKSANKYAEMYSDVSKSMRANSGGGGGGRGAGRTGNRNNDYSGMNKQILDSSVRTSFEKVLIEEIASAVCLPVRNINIEEVMIYSFVT
jgi:hypothetical protein